MSRASSVRIRIWRPTVFPSCSFAQTFSGQPAPHRRLTSYRCKSARQLSRLRISDSNWHKSRSTRCPDKLSTGLAYVRFGDYSGVRHHCEAQFPNRSISECWQTTECWQGSLGVGFINWHFCSFKRNIFPIVAPIQKPHYEKPPWVSRRFRFQHHDARSAFKSPCP